MSDFCTRMVLLAQANTTTTTRPSNLRRMCRTKRVRVLRFTFYSSSSSSCSCSENTTSHLDLGRIPSDRSYFSWGRTFFHLALLQYPRHVLWTYNRATSSPLSFLVAWYGEGIFGRANGTLSTVRSICPFPFCSMCRGVSSVSIPERRTRLYKDCTASLRGSLECTYFFASVIVICDSDPDISTRRL